MNNINEWKSIVDAEVERRGGVTTEEAGKFICKLHNFAEKRRKELMRELDVVNQKERYLASFIWSSERGY